MRDIEKLKKQLKEDNSFKEKFKDVKDAEEAVILAKELGYDIKKEELENDEDLNEDLLEAVSGGKNRTKISLYNFATEDGAVINVGGEKYTKDSIGK